MALPENALRVMCLVPEGSGAALASQRLLASTPRALLPPTCGEPSGDPFARYIPRAFSLQGIFPDPWCARTGPLMPKVGRKSCHSELAGGISRYGSKYGPPRVDLSEVVQMKRNPKPNYSLSIALRRNALRVTWSPPEARGSAPADRRLLASTPASEPRSPIRRPIWQVRSRNVPAP